MRAYAISLLVMLVVAALAAVYGQLVLPLVNDRNETFFGHDPDDADTASDDLFKRGLFDLARWQSRGAPSYVVMFWAFWGPTLYIIVSAVIYLIVKANTSPFTDIRRAREESDRLLRTRREL